MSHVAAAFFTRPWDSVDDTVMVSIDGVGEIQSATIHDSKFNLIDDWIAPKSVGLSYTMLTTLIGLRALEDEYVVMGLSSYGKPIYAPWLIKWYDSIEQHWEPEFDGDIINSPDNVRTHADNELYAYLSSIIRQIDTNVDDDVRKYADLAASMQKLAEHAMFEIMTEARKHGSKLVYGGGCAQNVVFNSMLHEIFDEVHIAIAPTDAGSALGCAALSWSKHTGKTRLPNFTPYLGYNIDREIDVKEVVDHLMEHKVCGIANGRAEFGPRALGNRSLIADVRFDIKDTVNTIKRRQKYRPFAPAILEEHAAEYFEGEMNEYMQYTSIAKHDYSPVTHVDGTARVQILKKDCPSIFRKIVEEYYARTGVPMLLNTSLNIRGRPMVNDEHDAELWEQEYGVKVF